jgi:hypothetical protein
MGGRTLLSAVLDLDVGSRQVEVQTADKAVRPSMAQSGGRPNHSLRFRFLASKFLLDTRRIPSIINE